MKAYITEIEIYNDDVASPSLIGKLKAFDEGTFTVTLDDKIVSGDDLRSIANMLDSDLIRKTLEV